MTTEPDASLPTGEVTLLFTDVEGSTRLWELHADRMPALLAQHDRILAAAIASAGGVLQLERAEGDSGFAVFADPRAALAGAVELQRAMSEHPWPDGLRLRTRAALHTGAVELRGDSYYGPVVNRCVKLRSLAHGGQTILSKATVDAVESAGRAPDGLTFVDLGTHRLKELAVPEHVYELRHADVDGDFPPLRSPDVERHNLPEIRGRLVGRSQEQREVTKALEVERLVTLTGTGGVGKTRLALEVAWARVGDAAAAHEGVWFADLTGARSDEDVDGIVASAVGVREQPGRPLIETISDQLGSSAALLVLDNCEHVVPAARRVVRGVLERCPASRVLATSREPLGLDAEHRRPVPGLPLLDAVDLFFDRSGLDRAAIEAEATDAIERLCERLDGIPFAIEIAAARAEAMGADAVERGVATALAEEAGRSVLEATLAWSHGLLERDDQVLFRRLGIFAGAFTLDAVEGVTAFDPLEAFDVLDLLDALVERSLVHRAEGGAYRQLVVAREYAAHLGAAAGEDEILAARHLSWCVGLVSAVAALDPRARFDRLRQAGDDLLVALDRRFDEERASVQVQLAADLEDFWALRGAFTEGRSRLEAVIARGAGFRSHRAAAHRSAGRLAKWQGDLIGATEHLERSRSLLDEILEELGAGESPHIPIIEEHLAHTLIELSEVALMRGDAAAALDLAQQSSSLRDQPYATYCVGMAERVLGDPVAAARRFTEALAAATAVGDDGLAACCLRLLGVIAEADGDIAAAAEYYRRALAIERTIGNVVSLTYALLSLAEVLALVGADATDLLEEGLALARSVGDRVGEAHGLSTLAFLTAASDPRAAADLHRTALELRTAVGMPAEQALSQLRVAAFDELDGLLDDAAVPTREAAATFRRLGDHRGVREALAQLARVEARRGRHAAGREALAEAVDARKIVRSPIEEADILDAAAWLARGQGRPGDAKALLEAASRLRATLGIVTSVPAAGAQQALRSLLVGIDPSSARPDALLRAALKPRM